MAITPNIGQLKTAKRWEHGGSTPRPHEQFGYAYDAAWNLSHRTKVRYVYDGRLVIQERHYTPGGGTLIPLNTVTYTRGNDLSGTLEGAGGIGGLLARSEILSSIAPGDGGSTATYHADGNGNITALVATNGLVLARYSYDPYGNLLGMSGPLAEANLCRFSSKEWHEKSGLVYYLYRYYEPSLQRWINRDPIGEDGGINLYEFAFSDPGNYSDSFGNCALAWRAFQLLSSVAVREAIGTAVAVGGGYAVGYVLTGGLGGAGAAAVSPGAYYSGYGDRGNAPPALIVLHIEKDHSEELNDASEDGYKVRPRDRQPDRMGGEDTDLAKGKKMTEEQRERLRREVEKYKRGEGRGGADNVDPSCLE